MSLPVRGEQPEILFLGLHEEQLVEGVSVGKRGLQLAGGVTLGQGQDGYCPQLFERGDHLGGIEGALALAGRPQCVVLQPHFPDRHGAHVQLHLVLTEEPALLIREPSLGSIRPYR